MTSINKLSYIKLRIAVLHDVCVAKVRIFAELPKCYLREQADEANGIVLLQGQWRVVAL